LAITGCVAYIFTRVARYRTKYHSQKKRLENVEDQINELMNMTTDSLGMSLRDKIEGIAFKKNDMFKDNKEEEQEIQRLKDMVERLDNERKALDRERKEIIQKNNFYSKEIEVLRSELDKRKTEDQSMTSNINVVEKEFQWSHLK